MDVNQITGIVVDRAIHVHRKLGPGLLETTYEACLEYELENKGLIVERQKPLPLIYESVHLEVGYRVDLLVENRVVVELKAVEAISDVHVAQILTYLKLSKCEIGLLINFNVALLKDGIKRYINR